MFDGHNNRLIPAQAIAHDVAAISERDCPFTEILIQHLHRSTDARVVNHDLHPFSNCAHGALGSNRVLQSKKFVAASKALQGVVVPDQV